MTGPSVEVVDRGDGGVIARLRELSDVALANEALDLDALDTCCGGPDDAVLWLDDGSGAAVVAPGADPAARHLQLIAVVPAAQGEGRGRLLLEAALDIARSGGAGRLELGGTATHMRYLWPGVDVRHLRLLALADSAGARWTGAAVNLSCPATFRALPPTEVDLRRVIDEADAAAAVEFTAGAFPHWLAELDRGIEHGTTFIASGSAGVVGFACHSVNRPGWFGPTAVDPACRGAGIGGALLAACCRDLISAGHDSVEIAWIGPVAFYAKVAGAAVSRVFRTGWFDLR
jgi:GNAT superfamily N-acetyltransferase